jgi:hypothetical protein
MNITWRLPQGYAFLGCDELLIQPHDQLADSSQGVLLRLVVVIEPNRTNALAFS